MSADMQGTSFAEDFEALKARHGSAYAGRQAVQFVNADGTDEFRAWTPYTCRQNDYGEINCVEERQM